MVILVLNKIRVRRLSQMRQERRINSGLGISFMAFSFRKAIERIFPAVCNVE